MNAADSFVDVLGAAGIDVVFGLPGSTEAPLLESIRQRRLRYVLGLHEGAVVSMADGYARAGGRPGAVGLHTSVGTLNGLGQMMNARRDSSPVVVTAGQKDRTVLSEEGFCALPGLLEATRAVTKWSYQSLSADAVALDLAHAIRVATAPPQGPVYLAVPEDLLAADVEDCRGTAAAIVTAPAVRSVPDPDAIVAAAELLRRAVHPILVVGGAARSAAGPVARLSRLAGLPVFVAPFTDLFDPPVPTADERYAGLYGDDPALLEGCDLVVAAGCRVFYPFSGSSRPSLPKGAALVHLHDDPVEIGRVTRADVGLLGDLRFGLAALADELDRAGGRVDAALLARREEQILGMLRLRRGRGAAGAPTRPMGIDTFADVLGRALPPETVMVEEAVRSARPLLRHLQISSGQRVLRSSGGALGWGTLAAVGATIGAPGRPVVAVVGDGSFHFSVQALWSASQIDASMVVVVLDNGGYLAVKRAIEEHLGVPHDPRLHPGTEISGIDHVEVAKGYGAQAVTATTTEILGDALRHALGAGGVWVIHVPVAQVRP
jgi:benzoylformate decarboxylase